MYHMNVYDDWALYKQTDERGDRYHSGMLDVNQLIFSPSYYSIKLISESVL